MKVGERYLFGNRETNRFICQINYVSRYVDYTIIKISAGNCFYVNEMHNAQDIFNSPSFILLKNQNEIK